MHSPVVLTTSQIRDLSQVSAKDSFSLTKAQVIALEVLYTIRCFDSYLYFCLSHLWGALNYIQVIRWNAPDKIKS